MSENSKQQYWILSSLSDDAILKGLGIDCTSALQACIFSIKKTNKIRIFHSEIQLCFAPCIIDTLWGILEGLPLDTAAQEGQGEGEMSPNASLSTAIWLGPDNTSPSSLNPSIFAWYKWSQKTLMHLKPDPRNLQLPGPWVGLESPSPHPQVWTPTPISVKIWLFLNLHSLSLPCYICNPEGMQNLSNVFLQGPSPKPGRCWGWFPRIKMLAPSKGKPKTNWSNFRSSV